jgi:hypothetical protein
MKRFYVLLSCLLVASSAVATDVPELTLSSELKKSGWSLLFGNPEWERPRYIPMIPLKVIKLENRKISRKGENQREPKVIFATITLYVYRQQDAEKLFKQRLLAMQAHKKKLEDVALQESFYPSELFWQTKEYVFFMYEGEFLPQQKEVKEDLKQQLVGK